MIAIGVWTLALLRMIDRLLCMVMQSAERFSRS